MASIPYPPWSAPSTLERDNKGGPRWKQWFRQRSGRKAKKETPSPTHQPSLIDDRYNMNPFIPRPSPFSRPFAANPLSPLANYSPGANRQIHTDYTSSEDNHDGVFDPEALIGKTNRPSLANVFPMLDSPSQKRPMVPVISVSPPLSPGRHSMSPPLGPRRHSVSTTPVQGYITPGQRPLRTSAPTDPTSDPRYNRRERRAEAFRKLPLLPNMQQQRRANIYSSPYKQPGYPGLVSSMSFPPWPQPHEQLQELQEELEEDEVDGCAEHQFKEQRQRARRGVVTKEQSKTKKKLQKLNNDDNSSDENVKGFDSFMMY